MRKIAIAFIVILASIMLIGCPGVTDPPGDSDSPVISNNATLSSLTITTGSVNHVYAEIESSYSLTVSNVVDSITVAPILSDAGASLTIDGVPMGDISITIPISVGENTLTLIVTAEDGETTLSYSVVITRLDDTVSDNTAPVITLSGDNTLTVEVNSTFTEPGYSALDAVEGDLTNAVVVTGSVNSGTVGTYTLYYDVSDTSGNAAIEVTRTVNVMEALEAPTLSLASGTYTSAQTVTITHSTPGVQIRYTLDATRITDETIGTLYTDPITISSNTTLIARAFKDNLIPSSEGYSWWYSGDYAIVTPTETNLIANGDFSDGLVLWRSFDNSHDGNGEASFSVIGGVFTANITDGGYKEWHVEMHYQPRFSLEQDQYYQLDFKAWAAAPRTIEVQLHEEGVDNNGDGSNYTEYFGRTINLTTTSQPFSFKMAMNEVTDIQASLRFNLGIETADVYIDDILLEKIIPVIVNPLDFPDLELRNAIATAVGKPFSEITDIDLATLEELEIDAEGLPVYNITGLEYCTGLENLDFDENQISDITPLSNLINIRHLDLDNNLIDDLSPLSQLSNLQFLSLGENPIDISDLSVLSTNSYPDLWGLRLDNGYDLGGGTSPINLSTDLTGLLNILDDLNNLSYLYMDDFYMNDTQFASLYSQVLAPRNLEWIELKIEDSSLTDTSLPLIANLTNLKCLDLFANNITDLSALTGLTNLRELRLDENEFTDLIPLQTLYDNGAFRDDGSWDELEIDIRECNLELWQGSSNRAIVDALISHGVDVIYEEGNQLVIPALAVVFDKNDIDATGSMDNQAIPTGSTASLTPYGFVKQGWRFEGWAITVNGSVDYIDQASYTMVATDNITLYAQWTKVVSLVSTFIPSNSNIINFPDVSILGNYAYIACHDNSNSDSGMLIVDISNPESPIEKVFVNRDFTTNVETSGNYAFINNGGLELEIFDISDPLNPVGPKDSYLYSDGMELKVYGDYCYVTVNDFGLKLLDISDPSNIQLIGEYSDTDTIGSYGENGAIELVGNLIYMVGRNYDLKVIDITDKTAPALVNTLKTGNSYANSICISGNYAYIANSAGIGVKIVDISNSQNLVIVGNSYINDGRYIRVLSDTAYISDSGDGMFIVDVSDKTNPKFITSLDASSTGWARKFEIVGNYIYLGHDHSDLAILKLENQADNGTIDIIIQ